MQVHRGIAEPRRKTSARSPEDPIRTRAYGEAMRGESASRRLRRSGGLAIAAEVFMNNASLNWHDNHRGI